MVHTLVLLAFVGPCPPGMECRHFPDRDPANNRVENLSWGTRQQNVDDQVPQGTRRAGESCPTAKLDDAVRRIREDFDRGVTQKELALRHNLDPSTIHGIVRRKRWKHLK